MSHQHLMAELEQLVSEARNPTSMSIDLLPTEDILKIMNREDALVPEAVARVIPQIAEAVEEIVNAFREGGRLIYIGAGTSARLGVLDASECPPTFSVPEGLVVGLIAGGPKAILHAVEGAEDDSEEGKRDLKAIDLSSKDAVVGIAVSGRTPYVVGALTYAKSIGAKTISLTCNAHSTLADIADIAISPVVGPEVVTGSTRLKSGTAQKLVLNMLTTASMIRIGKTYENLMVDLTISNQKLQARAIRIIAEATGCSADVAETYLSKSENNVKAAILMILTGLQLREAEASLIRHQGFLRKAIAEHKF
ncbi:N-acetylmuramic acid 6-phosphate etherase (plasmid) [Rhizobium oryzihabitans]|uniref:N-acetylmuramic acid 6-phosphate etherase n=2 Tax=Bacteria TaxID=2 RepID=A0A7L5BS12_9HYPH|nr:MULTISPECIES: N-acetylmuramic acid 6-phosphate etherase [Rhizobium/Agrobacterium group]QIB41466.1 N-acetylmuramic acid 6-phosphate etherase [Rhizobium oryzihabitans]RSC24857.1 N-acetylmuramic acid 6-phosphate etherase [Agrobacterium sp. FDAARGOS_525]